MRIFQTDTPITLDDDMMKVERSLKALTGTDDDTDYCTINMDLSKSPHTSTIVSGCTDVDFSIKNDFDATLDAFDITVEFTQP